MKNEELERDLADARADSNRATADLERAVEQRVAARYQEQQRQLEHEVASLKQLLEQAQRSSKRITASYQQDVSDDDGGGDAEVDDDDNNSPVRGDRQGRDSDSAASPTPDHNASGASGRGSEFASGATAECVCRCADGLGGRKDD